MRPAASGATFSPPNPSNLQLMPFERPLPFELLWLTEHCRKLNKEVHENIISKSAIV